MQAQLEHMANLWLKRLQAMALAAACYCLLWDSL
jgi:hypothetical protein